MLNERAVEQTDPAEATADFILARRVRREVRDIAEAWLKEASEPGKEQPPDKIFWVHATLAKLSWVSAMKRQARCGWRRRTR